MSNDTSKPRKLLKIKKKKSSQNARVFIIAILQGKDFDVLLQSLLTSSFHANEIISHLQEHKLHSSYK